jgi:hypothetical protein
MQKLYSLGMLVMGHYIFSQSEHLVKKSRLHSGVSPKKPGSSKNHALSKPRQIDDRNLSKETAAIRLEWKVLQCYGNQHLEQVTPRVGS